MHEHLIRLRGGWLRSDPDSTTASTGTGRRVSLPFNQPALPAGRVRLVRAFGPPPLDHGRETLALRLAQVSGLESVQLNGRTIARPPAGTDWCEFPLPVALPRRNLLVLDVNFDRAIAPSGVRGTSDRWGEIALVIGARDVSSTSATAADAGPPSGRCGGEEEELLGGCGHGA